MALNIHGRIQKVMTLLYRGWKVAVAKRHLIYLDFPKVFDCICALNYATLPQCNRRCIFQVSKIPNLQNSWIWETLYQDINFIDFVDIVPIIKRFWQVLVQDQKYPALLLVQSYFYLVLFFSKLGLFFFFIQRNGNKVQHNHSVV